MPIVAAEPNYPSHQLLSLPAMVCDESVLNLLLCALPILYGLNGSGSER